MKTVNVLWTGGWDSTFRVLQLSTKNVMIQPYYLKDNRKSEKFELDTIKFITEAIRCRPLTKCTLNDLISVNVSDVEVDEEIKESYKGIHKKFKKESKKSLGGQYEWLARFAKSVGVLELCIEKGTKPIVAIERYGGLKRVDDEIIGEYYIVDKSSSPASIINVFGYYHYPLVDYSKLTMKREAEEKKFIDLMNKTWFCHKPRNNQPCGVCNPCMSTMEEGFQYRFSSVALRRYKVKKFIKPIENTFFYRGLRKLYRLAKS